MPVAPRQVLHHDREGQLAAEPGRRALRHLLALQAPGRAQGEDGHALLRPRLGRGGVRPGPEPAGPAGRGGLQQPPGRPVSGCVPAGGPRLRGAGTRTPLPLRGEQGRRRGGCGVGAPREGGRGAAAQPRASQGLQPVPSTCLSTAPEPERAAGAHGREGGLLPGRGAGRPQLRPGWLQRGRPLQLPRALHAARLPVPHGEVQPGRKYVSPGLRGGAGVGGVGGRAEPSPSRPVVSVSGGRSRLHLFDLGSCEGAPGRGGEAPGGPLCLSLSALGSIVLALVSGAKHVPHR